VCVGGNSDWVVGIKGGFDLWVGWMGGDEVWGMCWLV
jgi:hypothetical protein